MQLFKGGFGAVLLGALLLLVAMTAFHGFGDFAPPGYLAAAPDRVVVLNDANEDSVVVFNSEEYTAVYLATDGTIRTVHLDRTARLEAECPPEFEPCPGRSEVALFKVAQGMLLMTAIDQKPNNPAKAEILSGSREQPSIQLRI